MLARKNNPAVGNPKVYHWATFGSFRVHSTILGKSSTTFRGNFDALDESKNETARSMSISYPYPVENCLLQVPHKELTLNLVR